MKLLISIVLIIGIFISAYSLVSLQTGTQNQLAPHQVKQELSVQKHKDTIDSQELTKPETEHLQQEEVIKKRLLEEFENAFIKQYTPPLGCENWQSDSHMVRCTNHKINAKKDFQQEFIEKRGLPKNTFDHPRLSFTK